MNKVTLNIGLDVSAKNSRTGDAHTIDPRLAEEIAQHMLFGHYVTMRVEQSNTEPTAVISLETDFDGEAVGIWIHHIADILCQDAIAYTFNGEGNMVGPRAEAWGEFNPQYFIVA